MTKAVGVPVRLANGRLIGTAEVSNEGGAEIKVFFVTDPSVRDELLDGIRAGLIESISISANASEAIPLRFV